MTLSETQTKDLIDLWQDIYNYAYHLEHYTYQPYKEVEDFARRLKNIIGNDELIRKLNSIK